MMRASVMLFALALLVGCAVPAPAATPPPPTPTAQPVSGTLGSFVVVDRTMFDVITRAADQRDSRPFELALSTGDLLLLEPGTRARVLKFDGRVAQFEILSGKYTGRAGWQYASALAP